MPIAIHELCKVDEAGRGLLPTSLTIKESEFVAVIGHNGAGKSTLLKMLAGWIVPDSGRASVNGISLNERLRITREVGFVPESPNLFEQFSVEYNLKLFANLFHVQPFRVEEILREFNLQPFRGKSVQSLSKGIKQRVSLGRSLLWDPPVLLLDEPSSGLDFATVSELHERLKSFHRSGKTILFSSHRSEEVLHLATRLIVLFDGRVVYDGSAQGYLESKTREALFL